MYIQFTEHAYLQEYHNDDHMPDDYRVTGINDEGVVQVKKEVGVNLVDAFDHVVEYNGDSA
jgi:hypothetical protein